MSQTSKRPRYFISIGRFPRLKTGVGSRGWHIFRKRNVVIAEWGPVEVYQGVPKQFFWARKPQDKVLAKKRSIAQAEKEIKLRIAEKCRPNRSGDRPYEPLPKNQKIRI